MEMEGEMPLTLGPSPRASKRQWEGGAGRGREVSLFSVFDPVETQGEMPLTFDLHCR
jgi:hypothetical protein